LKAEGRAGAGLFLQIAWLQSKEQLHAGSSCSAPSCCVCPLAQRIPGPHTCTPQSPRHPPVHLAMSNQSSPASGGAGAKLHGDLAPEYRWGRLKRQQQLNLLRPPAHSSPLATRNNQHIHSRTRPGKPGAAPGQLLEVPARFSARMFAIACACSLGALWVDRKLFMSTAESMVGGCGLFWGWGVVFCTWRGCIHLPAQYRRHHPAPFNPKSPEFQERASQIGPVAERTSAPPVFLNPIRNRLVLGLLTLVLHQELGASSAAADCVMDVCCEVAEASLPLHPRPPVQHPRPDPRPQRPAGLVIGHAASWRMMQLLQWSCARSGRPQLF
jgi:hypothetical protein